MCVGRMMLLAGGNLWNGFSPKRGEGLRTLKCCAESVLCGSGVFGMLWIMSIRVGGLVCGVVCLRLSVQGYLGMVGINAATDHDH